MTESPSLQALIYRASSTFKAKTGENTPAIDALAAVIGGIAFGQYGYADYLFKQLHPETCDEEWLYLHADRLKVFRISSSYAQGTCNFDGIEQIPSSIILKTRSGNEYEVTAATNSSLPVPIKAIKAGNEGNLPSGENLYLVTAVTGLHPENITSNEINGGSGLEDLEHWRSRVVLAYNETNAVGRIKDYEFWAVSSHADIDFAWALDNSPELGHVTVFIANKSENPLLTTQIQNVTQKYIDNERLAGCHVFAKLPTLKPVNVIISNIDDVDTRNKIEDDLAIFFKNRLGNREKLYPSEISSVITNVTAQFTMIYPSVAIEMLDNELLTYGGVQWQ